MWLSELKRALILHDFTALEHLIVTMPTFDSNNQIQEAVYLLGAVQTLLETERTSTLSAINQLKNTLDFLKASETSPQSSLNLKF
jgi:hypothetical protein